MAVLVERRILGQVKHHQIYMAAEAVAQQIKEHKIKLVGLVIMAEVAVVEATVAHPPLIRAVLLVLAAAVEAVRTVRGLAVPVEYPLSVVMVAPELQMPLTHRREVNPVAEVGVRRSAIPVLVEPVNVLLRHFRGLEHA